MRLFPAMPVIVREMDDDEAIIYMVDSNLQREHILPSERAFAYKMKLDAIKHQGARTDLSQEGTSSRVGMKSPQALELVGKEAGDSRNQVHRYIRLTELIPEIRLDAMDYAQAAPSLSQAQRLKKLSQEGDCKLDAMCEVMNEVKKDDMTTITIPHDVLRKYFPKSYTPQQMQDVIVKLLEQWQKKRNREQAR